MRKLIRRVLSGIVATFAVIGFWYVFIRYVFHLVEHYATNYPAMAADLFLLAVLVSWGGAIVTYKWLLQRLEN